MDSPGSESQGVSKAELETLSLLLEDRSFVDYFNIFLCLPVFGQHVFYNFMDSEFQFEPPIKQRRDLYLDKEEIFLVKVQLLYLDKKEILLWLCKERYELFKKTSLHTDYQLCSKLRTVDLTIDGIKRREETDDGEDTTTLCKNVLGTAIGMLMFRESLRGTCGETVYRCWRDIEAWRHIKDDARRIYWKHAIKTKYMHQGSQSEVKGRLKIIVFQGTLNFELVPENEIQELIWEGLEADNTIYKVETDEALLQLQVILLDAMKRYWVPRFLLHFRRTTSKETMEILTRPVPGDLDYLNHERRLRCRFMFPTIYQESDLSTPTSVFVSKSTGELPPSPESLKLTSSSEVSEEDHDDILPTELLSLWGGPTKEIAVEKRSTPTDSDSIRSFPEDESPDIFGRHQVQSRNMSAKQVVRDPIPIVLTSYLGGKRRTILGQTPAIGNRVLWSLAADVLAGSPFRTFLFAKGHMMDINYLNFWTDVRDYLDTDEHTLDAYGFPLKRLLAHKFADTYLLQGGQCTGLFSETLKNSMFTALSNSNDVSLLCMAQDIVLETLWEPLKMYIVDERRRFLRQVRGYRYHLSLKQRQRMKEFASIPTSAGSTISGDGFDPMFFFQCTTLKGDSASSPNPPLFEGSPLMSVSSANGSRAPTSYHISITEEQMWKAMELTVLCNEYGASMMVPQYPPKPEQLVDVLHGDYGSLHVTRVPAVRYEWIRNLVEHQKINIETVRVSRKVILDKIDLSTIVKKDDTDRTMRSNRLIVRRNGMVLERPTKPKTFVEVLTTQIHFDFFKRFMMLHKASLPLLFWRAVEDLKDLSNSKTRNIRVTQIMRKFFGKYAKYGAALDCNEDIIRQIPNMEKVTPGILICAQAAVYRSMERKWYPLYIDTYPPESESGAGSPPSVIPVRAVTPDFAEVVQRSKKPKKRMHAHRTLQLWRNLTRALVEFCKAMRNSAETQLLEVFLKCEVEKEQQNARSTIAPAGDNAIEKNIIMSSIAANVQTRVVVKNRLIILNRLPADLRFWLEVQKYHELIDGANVAIETEFLCDKARSLISCFLASEVAPKVQINIPNDMAANIINNLASSGPQRGLFHDAIFLLFPVLYHYWKRYTEEMTQGNMLDFYLEFIEKSFKNRITDTPHADSLTLSYIDLDPDSIKTVHQVMTGLYDENMIRIHFSISEGIVMIYPQPKAPKSETGRRMTKHSLVSHDTSSASPGKESKMQLHPGDKKDRKDGRLTARLKLEKQKEEEAKLKRQASMDKKKKEKKDKKIVVKDASEEHSPSDLKPSPKASPPIGARRLSSDKSRRLSQLVEALNTERVERMQSQNRRFSKLIKLDEVVTVAMQELSESGSLFS